MIRPSGLRAFTGGDRARFEAARRKAVADGAASVDYRFHHANGEVVWLRDVMRLTPAGADRAMALTGTRVDITDLMSATDKSASERDENRRLRSLLADNPCMTYRYRVPETLGRTPWVAEYVSTNIQEHLGYTPAQFCAEPWFWRSRLHPDEKDRVLADVQDLLDRDEHAHEYRFRHSDGSYRRMRDRLRVMRDQDGKPV